MVRKTEKHNAGSLVAAAAASHADCATRPGMNVTTERACSNRSAVSAWSRNLSLWSRVRDVHNELKRRAYNCVLAVQSKLASKCVGHVRALHNSHEKQRAPLPRPILLHEQPGRRTMQVP